MRASALRRPNAEFEIIGGAAAATQKRSAAIGEATLVRNDFGWSRGGKSGEWLKLHSQDGYDKQTGYEKIIFHGKKAIDLWQQMQTFLIQK